MNTAYVSVDHFDPFSRMSSIGVEEHRETVAIACSVTTSGKPAHKLSQDEGRLVQALKSGDEAAFNRMIDLYHTGLLRLARTFLASEAIAEEVVQDTWVCALEGINRFEGRSSFKTWLYRILMNQAKTRAVRENKYVPLTYPGGGDHDDHDEAAEPSSFHQTGSMADSWIAAPISWDDHSPERLLLSKESLERIHEAIQALPPVQKRVLVLRDVEGLDSKEVCQLLNLTETNQRVLLHRARIRVRRALDAYVKG